MSTRDLYRSTSTLTHKKFRKLFVVNRAGCKITEHWERKNNPGGDFWQVAEHFFLEAKSFRSVFVFCKLLYMISHIWRQKALKKAGSDFIFTRHFYSYTFALFSLLFSLVSWRIFWRKFCWALNNLCPPAPNRPGKRRSKSGGKSFGGGNCRAFWSCTAQRRKNLRTYKRFAKTKFWAIL